MLRTFTALIFALLLTAATTAVADTVAIVWTCTVNEGHTVEDLEEVHGKWVTWARSRPGGEGIGGSILSSSISSNIDTVLIVDSFPSPKVMAASWADYEKTVGGEMEAAYDRVSTCTENSMWRARPVGD